MTDIYLTGKVAWVTGGASGMGRATALALARAGANVAVGSLLASQRKAVLKDQNCHTPPDDALASAKGEIESQGVRAIGMALDVCSNESVAAGYRAVVEAFGKVDILLNAAGSSARKFMVDHPDELCLRTLYGNLTGPYGTTEPSLHGITEPG